MSDIEDIDNLAQDVVDKVKYFFRGLLKKYWYLIILLIIGVVGAFVGIILVILTFIDNTGIGTWYFNDFSVGAVVLIAILMILWILLLVILPTAGYFGLIAGAFWWKVLTSDEKNTLKIWMKQEDKKESRKRKMKHGGEGGGFGFITLLAFLIIVFVQGNWWTTFNNLPFSYFVITYLTGIIWIAIIAGVVGAVVLALWLTEKLWK